MSVRVFHNKKQDLERDLSMLEADALNFAVRFINDPNVRMQYMANIKKLSDEYLQRVKVGELTPEAAATEVRFLRNQIMEAGRLELSDIGVAYSVSKKETGRTLAGLLERYANKKFKLPFDQLNASQQNSIYLEIIESGGRTEITTNILAKRLSALGRGFIIVTIGISIYNIATADDKLRETAKEGSTLGGGILGGAAGGAVAGLACGPGAPLCVGIGVFIGGALGALGVSVTFDWLF